MTTSFSHKDTALVVTLAIASAIVLAKDITVGGLRHGDSAAHAMDGVLIHDWVVAGPNAWSHPMDFAERQYAHYPTLGIGRHYPPGFAIVEAAFFAVFGISAISARAVVVLFGVIGTVGLFAYVRIFASRWTAFLAAVLFISLPATTHWGRQVMLEVPTMAMLIWTAVLLARYFIAPTRTRFTCLLGLAVLCVLFKQTALFILAAVTVTLAVGVLIKKINGRHFFVSCIVSVVVLCLVLLSLDGHGRLLWRGDATFASRWSFDALTYYFRFIPRQVGIVMLCVTGVVVFFVRRLSSLHLVFLASWFLSCYAMLVLADYKNPRFLYFALLPLPVLAAFAITGLFDCIKPVAGRHIGGTTVACACFVLAFGAPVEHRPDLGLVVAANKDRIQGRAVLFSGLREGDFVFAVRQHLPWRSSVVIRAGKLLYTCNGRTDLEFKSAIDRAEQLEPLLDSLAFQVIFAERPNKLDLDQERWLRDYLRDTDDYQLAGTWDFIMGSKPYRDTTVDLYLSRRPQRRAVNHLDIWIPRSRRTIRVDLSQWS